MTLQMDSFDGEEILSPKPTESISNDFSFITDILAADGLINIVPVTEPGAQEEAALDHRVIDLAPFLPELSPTPDPTKTNGANGKSKPPRQPREKAPKQATKAGVKSANERRTVDPEEDLVRAYLIEIGNYPLLTKDDEVRLAKVIENGKAAKAKLESADDQTQFVNKRQLEREIRAGKKAKEDFINSNLRLVVSIAKRYQGRGVEFLDLMQEGNIGLEHAVDLFEWQKGFKFSTYATWWIRQAVTRAVANKGSTIRLPVHMHDAVRKLSKARADLVAHNIDPTMENLSVALDMTPEKVLSVIEASNLSHIRSLDEPVRGGGDTGMYNAETTIGELTPDTSSRDGYNEVESNLVKSALKTSLRKYLDEREYEVIVRRLGLDGGTRETLDEIGVDFDLSRERIRQLEARALSKLRHPWASEELSGLYDIID